MMMIFIHYSIVINNNKTCTPLTHISLFIQKMHDRQFKERKKNPQFLVTHFSYVHFGDDPCAHSQIYHFYFVRLFAGRTNKI